MITASAVQRVRCALAWRWWYYRTQFGRGVLGQCWKYPKMFCSWSDISQCARAFLTVDACSKPLTLRVRKLNGTPLLCRPSTSDPWVLWDVFDRGYHLPPVHIRGNANILDLGANVGYSTAHFAQLYPQAQVIGVEMDSANAMLARQNVAAFGQRCRIINAAVWSSDGEISYAPGEEQGMFVASLASQPQTNVRQAPARSMNSIIRESGFSNIDYVKMDIEGAESEVFKSGVEWTEAVQTMQIELHPPAKLAGIAAILTSVGFRCYKAGDRPLRLVAVR
jgi:FkbM family methyltransferase